MVQRCTRRGIIAVVALGLLVGLTSPAHSQEQDPFFPKDFAKDPLGRPLPTARATVRTPPAQQPTLAPGTAPGRVTALPTTAPLAVPSPLGSGVKITKINAVISGLDPVHLEESLSELVRVAEKHNFDLGAIYVVGIPLGGQLDERFGQQILKLAVRGGLMEIVGAPPEGITVNRSPSWILRTEKGDVLLEGFLKLAEFIAADGTLLEPTATSAEVIPLAAQTVIPTPRDNREAAEQEARRRIEELKSQLP